MARGEQVDLPSDDVILVAGSLGPADVSELPANVLGFALAEGGVTAVEEALRIRPTWINGGGETPGPSGAIVSAMLAVASGLCRHVLCFRTVWEATHTELVRTGKIDIQVRLRIQPDQHLPCFPMPDQNPRIFRCLRVPPAGREVICRAPSNRGCAHSAGHRTGHDLTGLNNVALGPALAVPSRCSVLRPGATVARAAHDAISRTVYAAVSGGPTVVGQAADVTLGKRDRTGERRLSTTPWGGLGLAAINGLVGDALERERSVLQEPMAVRVDGLAVPCEASGLAAGNAAANRRIVVFVHGLMGTEFPWWWGGGPSQECYGSRLKRDLGATPVFVRYNTGRHISENGHSLGELIADLVAAWPVDVDQLALVGHSMGGLVCRSACYQASEQGSEWISHVGHVVSLGTPHMGAPLAQGVHYASEALHAVPETRPFARFLRRRSGGIRDLRHGSLVDEDWRDCDPDALRAKACKEVPLLEGATHCFVGRINRKRHTKAQQTVQNEQPADADESRCQAQEQGPPKGGPFAQDSAAQHVGQ